jgi:hypothetical protein
MGLHKINSKAIRFNGFTDGIVVPTGQHKESGINLLRPTYSGGSATTKSDATKIGRLHLPTESNPLNRILSAFTIDAFIVPNYGGTVVVKPNCFELKVGDPFKNAPIEFSIHCIGRVFRLTTTFDINTLRESHSGTYGGGEHLPDDISEGAQPLMLVTAQFTGDEMRVYVNTNLVGKLNLIEQRILDNVSSDFFIGGRGGEFRGVIESVRINKGETSPLLQPLAVTDETIGLWDFEDEINIPSIHFFDNANESSATQGRDGNLDRKSLFETPLVCVAYDFQNINDLGYFRIYERPEHPNDNDDNYTAMEKLASIATGIPLADIRRQTWYSTSLNLNAYTYGTNTGSLDYLTSDRVKHSSLNAVVNQSGTHPLTGLTKTASGRTQDITNGADVFLANISDLDPMVNPIERIRIISLDFANNRVVCQSVHLQNDTTTAATIENHPKGQGFLFDHVDGTPIWFVLGNADLVIDPGNKSTSSLVANQVTRQKDAFTRARFTQGQRFEDRSGNRNTAFFVSKQSRIPSTIGSAAATTEAPDPDPPFQSDMIMWLPVNALTGYSDGATVTHVPDYSGNEFGMYAVGTWAYQAQSAEFNSFPSLKITSSDGALVNIGTNDGESKEITHQTGTNGFTAFWMIHSSAAFTLSSTYDLIGENASTNKTFFGGGTTSNAFTLTNNGVTTTVNLQRGGSSAGHLITPGLLSITFNHTSNNAVVHRFAQEMGTFVGKVVNDYRFDNNLFGLFGRALTTDPATKTGTASNKAPQNTEFAEFILYDRALTDAERQQVQGYFLDKYTVI